MRGGYSAKIADQMDFEALYMTGYGTVASHLGLPDAGIATYTDMVSRVAVIAGGSKTPLIADGDTGYGGLLNVQYAVRGYAAAGAIAASCGAAASAAATQTANTRPRPNISPLPPPRPGSGAPPASRPAARRRGRRGRL